MNLSKNFILEEFTKSQAALRRGLDNTPNTEQVENIRDLVDHVLQPVRTHFARPVIITSGFRSRKLNSAIGGSAVSHHMQGMAADFEIYGIANGVIAEWIAGNLPFTQLILEYYTPGVPDSGWVHVAYDAQDLRQESLTVTRTIKGVQYRPGLIV
ncbi:MAG: D-Ala-D-Ala carboxypeptidase family metallohydrolase [Saprospiraceae bacterium]|nr:D-Ala-D-Ala carboxypeptidase family metallohydrolase [Saprospiraceae bacterium]